METKKNNLVRINSNLIDLYEDEIKDNDSQLYQKLKACISKRGQLKTILVSKKDNERYECLEGSKVLKIIKELGIEEVLAIDCGYLTENEKTLLRIEVSRDYFLTDYVQIGKMLKQITEEIRVSDACNTIPFDIRQAEHLISMTEFDWQAFADGKQIENQSNLFDFADEIEEDNN